MTRAAGIAGAFVMALALAPISAEAQQITEFTLPTSNSAPQGIATGPDEALWFVERNNNKIGRITTAGAITEFAIPTPSSSPLVIKVGPDVNLWFTEQTAAKIGRITTAGEANYSAHGGDRKRGDHTSGGDAPNRAVIEG